MQPHPFLTGAILYLLDVPPRVKRENIKAAFKCCGTIKLTSLGYAPGVDSLKTRTWEVLFESMVKAEMALATLQGAPVPGLSLLAMEHTMTLSHVPEPWLITHPPVPTVLPLYVSNNNIVPVDAQAIFTLSRVAGSIASVHINTDLGHGVPDILLQYWDEEGARAGLKLYNEQLDKQWARIINPRHLICEVKDLRDFKSGRVQGASKVLNAAVFQAEIIAAFSIFGDMTHLDICFPSPSTAHVDIGFETQEQALAAQRATNDTPFCGCHMQVWLLEPDDVKLPVLKPPPSFPSSASAPESPRFPDSPRPSAPGPGVHRRGAGPAPAFSSPPPSAEDLFRARSRFAEARRAMQRAKSQHAQAAELEQEATRRREQLSLAAATARREREEAEQRERAAAQALDAAEKEAAALGGRVRSCAQSRRDASKALASAETALREEEERFTQGIQRTRDLAESVARMSRLDVQAKAAQSAGTEAAEGSGAQGSNDALQREELRCRTRDERLAPVHLAWTPQRSISRYLAVSSEFDSIQFTDAQPLTFASVPWPVLHPPHSMTIEHVGWSTVEAFFAAAKGLMSDAEYAELITRSLRRFHPDRWRARRLLSTVQDRVLREHIEAAGGLVAQVVTPLRKGTAGES